MNPEKKDYISKWLFKANEDIAVIKQLTAEHPEIYTGAICFHAQQAVEKFLKTFLIFHDIEFAKSHDVDYLLNLCREVETSYFENLDLKSLADFGVSIRYPDDFIIPELEDALIYKEIALKVKDIIELIID